MFGDDILGFTVELFKLMRHEFGILLFRVTALLYLDLYADSEFAGDYSFDNVRGFCEVEKRDSAV